MHAFRRIKIEVNIGSTTIVSLDPLAGDRFAIPPRFMHDETTASIDERHVRTFVGRYYLSVMMARAWIDEERQKRVETRGRGWAKNSQKRTGSRTETDHRIIVAFTLGQTRSIVMDKLLIEEKMVSNSLSSLFHPSPSPLLSLSVSVSLPNLANGNSYISTSSHEQPRLSVHL